MKKGVSPNQDAQPFYNHLFLLIANYAPLGKIYYNLFACISGFSFILLSIKWFWGVIYTKSNLMKLGNKNLS